MAGAGAAWDDGWAGGCEGGAGSLPHALKITVITAADRSKDFMCVFPESEVTERIRSFCKVV